MSRFYNRTRTSRSIPRKLLKEGRFYLIPLYYLLLTSELANEGIHNSGSYRFADHIYAGKPKGKYIVGHLLDATFLRMKSARSFRARYLYAKEEMHRFIASAPPETKRLDILAVPSGLARELFEVAQELRATGHPQYGKIRWHGLDLDCELVGRLVRRAAELKCDMDFRCGDALDPTSYSQPFDMIISLGFGEFLDDAQLVRFYRLVYDHLKPGGTFVTSGMLPHPLSDYLLRNIGELHTHYRSADHLKALAEKAGLANLRTYRDSTRLQNMLISVRE